MRLAVTAAATLGAAAMITGLGTVSAGATTPAAGPSVVTPHQCENFTHPNNSTAEYLTNSGTKNLYSGASTDCGSTGILNPGNIFDAYCWHGNSVGQEWIYGHNTSNGASGWVYAPSVVKVSGTLKPCNG